MRLLIGIFLLSTLSSCGGLAGALGAVNTMNKIEKEVCPSYPTDPNCSESKGKVISINDKYCTTFDEWNKKMKQVFKECRPESKGPYGSGSVTKDEYLSKLSKERKDFCDARHSFPSGDVVTYRERWQKTFASVLRSEKVIFNKDHKCSGKAQLTMKI